MRRSDPEEALGACSDRKTLHRLQIEGRTETGRPITKRRVLLFGISGSLVLLDQITKALARTYLAGGEIVKPFGNDLLWFLYVQNPGLAFGMTFLSPLVLAGVSAVAAVALGWYLYTNPNQVLWQSVPLALIMGGAAGNLIDRVFFRQVTDFISVDLPDFLMDRFFVFNVADSAVSVGVTLLLIASFFPEPKPESQEVSPPRLDSGVNGIQTDEQVRS